MSRNRPSSPPIGALPRRQRRPRRHWSFERLERRILLSGTPIVATPEELARARPLTGDMATGTIAPGGLDFFRIDPTTDQLLIAQVHAEGAHTRLSLLDGQGHLLVQSDGLSSTDRDNLIAQHLTAGTDYLEVEGLAGASDYTMTIELTNANLPNTQIRGAFRAIAVGDFNGDGRVDLAGRRQRCRVGAAGRRRRDVPTARELRGGDQCVTALVAGDFNGDGRVDLAVAGNNVAGAGVVSVLLGNGDGTFQRPVNYAAGINVCGAGRG